MPYIGRQPQVGNYVKLDDISSQFNGSQTSFSLTVNNETYVPQKPEQLIVSLSGVIQEPVSAYTISGGNIVFSSAPISSDTFFGIGLGDVLDIGVPSDNTITASKHADNSLNGLKYTGDFTGASTVNLRDELDRRYVTPEMFGAVGDGATDDLSALQTARDALVSAGGGTLFLPQYYRITDSFIIDSPDIVVQGVGWHTGIKTDLDVSYAKAGIILEKNANRCQLVNFRHDHQGQNYTDVNSGYYGGNIAMGSGIVVMPDDCTVDRLNLLNAWDTGVFVGSVNSDGTFNQGSPIGFRGSNCHGEHNGRGDGGAARTGKVGSCINIGTGRGSVSNCTDDGSYLGFIADTGGLGKAEFVNCWAFNTRYDNANPGNGSGYSFYCATTNSTYTNCVSLNSEYRGFWADQGGLQSTYNGCIAKGAQQDGWFIKGGEITLNGCRADDNGQASADTYDGFLIEAPSDLANIIMDSCAATGTQQKHGVRVDPDGNSVEVHLDGGRYEGATAPFSGFAGTTTEDVQVARRGEYRTFRLGDDSARSFTPSHVPDAAHITLIDQASAKYVSGVINTNGNVTEFNASGGSLSAGSLSDGTGDGTDGEVNVSMDSSGIVYVKNMTGVVTTLAVSVY